MGAMREVRVQDRTSRLRLKVRHHPYWRSICEGAHIGYYRGTRGGRWIARYRRPGSSDDYTTNPLGAADDLADANGESILNFKQALGKATDWISNLEAGGTALDPNMTVLDAVNAYITARDARTSALAGRTTRSSASYTLRRHVEPDKALSELKLRDLSEADLRAWQRRIATAAETTTRRIANDLKAALNFAFEEHRKVLPKDLPVTIKFGLKSISTDAYVPRARARDNQVLDDEDVRKILTTCRGQDEEGDRYRLALLLAATGARFSQIVRMRVADAQPALKRLMVPSSRKGRNREQAYATVQVGDDVIAALESVLSGRPHDAALLERWRYRQTTPTQWERVDRRAWTNASEMRRWWKEVVDAAGLPGVIPYALRHSSIVRGIRVGLPIRLVAALHDTSVAMIERHYARWITESLDEVAAKAVVSLVK